MAMGDSSHNRVGRRPILWDQAGPLHFWESYSPVIRTSQPLETAWECVIFFKWQEGFPACVNRVQTHPYTVY
jgi:hypothetical protein